MPTIFWEFPVQVKGLAGVGRDFDTVDAAETWFDEYKDHLLNRTLMVSGGNIYETTPEGFALARSCERPAGPTGPTGYTGPSSHEEAKDQS